MKDILIATKNEHKVVELKAVLEPLGYNVKTLQDYPLVPDIAETGDTFKANAFIKAKTLQDITKTIVLADDSGLVVEALDGAPGIYSARYAGDNADYQDNNRKLLKEMKNMTNKNAYFITVICIIKPGEDAVFVEGRLSGTIATSYKGTHGFGYDPIFVLPDRRHLAELPTDEKNTMSHRAKAIRNAIKVLSAF